jgi:LPXTG-site transpeptidase (sortase) family protein
LVRRIAIAVGLLCVLIGAADVTTRLAENTVGSDAAFLAFGPAAAINNPQFAATSTPGNLTPARLRIPSLGVDAKVESVGTKADGTMGTPSNFKDVSWYSLGAKPGAAGSAVFAGHVNNGLMSSGVFANLSQIKKGDYITLADDAGRTKVYQVSSVNEYAANASTESIFATTGPSQIVLITCDGDWVPSAKTFDKRLVVVAKPAH